MAVAANKLRTALRKAEGLYPRPPIGRTRLGMAQLGLDGAQKGRRPPSLLNVLVEQMWVLVLLPEPSLGLSGFSCPIPLIDAAIFLVGFPFPKIFLLGGSTALADGLGWGK